MDLKDYWHTKQLYFSKTDWINNPNNFAKLAIKYFSKEGTVLDLGAGQGCDTRLFAKMGYKVTSADFSETALEISKARAHQEKISGITFLQLDMSRGKLPFPDQSFNTVYASLSLHYFDEETTNSLFKEVSRILKKDGIFAYNANPMSDPQTKIFKEIGEGFFEDPDGLRKRYFTVDYAKNKATGLFEILLADAEGKTFDPKKPDGLIQFIGKKK